MPRLDPAIFQQPKHETENQLDYDFLQVEYEAVREAITERNWDFWTIISGNPGVGKSTLGLLLALITDPEANDPNTIATRTAYDTGTFIENLVEHEGPTTEIFDEAIQGAMGKEAMTTDYKALEATGEMVRGLNHHAIMTIPRFWGFGPYWRNTRADAWLHVERRGRARVHIPSPNLYSKDDTFWQYVCTVEYPTLEGTEIWDAYDATKKAYLRPAIRRRLADVRAKTQPQDEDEGPTRAMQLRNLAEEAAGVVEAWTANGKPDRAYLIRQYGLPDHEAGIVARTMRAFRK